MTHLTITAHLDTPIIGEIPILDGPLAWAWFQLEMAAGRNVDPITDDTAPDAQLPFERWDTAGTWGWCVSAPISTAEHYTAVEIRRKPAVIPMAHHSKDREHHAGLGPMKARSATLAAAWHPEIVWHADVTDRSDLEALLAATTHLGGRHRNGFGHVRAWTVDDGPTDGWKDRPMPPDHPARAPYWHPSRRAVA